MAYVINPKIMSIVQKFAGTPEKLGKVQDLVSKLVEEGKKPERAYADALETLKLLPKPILED